MKGVLGFFAAFLLVNAALVGVCFALDAAFGGGSDTPDVVCTQTGFLGAEECN